MALGWYKKQRHRYLPAANMNYNTTYLSSIDFELNWVICGRIWHNILDHKLGLKFNPNIAPTTDFADVLLRITKIFYERTKNFLKWHAALHQKQKKYYD